MDQSALAFIESCKKVNHSLSGITEKEIVSDDFAFESEVIIKNMKVDGIGDALLFASAINILNAYVKQSTECRETLGYSFKKGVDILLRYVSRNPSEMMKAEVQKDNDMSLCLMEINTIQFAFHNIDLDDDTRKLMAKDLDHPTMKWDGIRKQACSVTLYQFAKENTYGRTNKMLDGSDFNEGLNHLLASFHKGELTLSDSKKKYYASSLSSKSKESTKKANYALRKRNISLLYKSSLETFLEELDNRTLFGTLFEFYENGYGFTLSPATKYEWKYAIESLGRILRASGMNPNAGIGMLYVRMMSKEFPAFIFASYDDQNIPHVALVQLLPWEKMNVTENDAVEYLGVQDGHSHKSVHPSAMMGIASETIKNLLLNKDAVVLPCTFLFNAVFSDESNIVSNIDKEILEASPVFYAEDLDYLQQFISEALKGNGEDIIGSLVDSLNKIQKLEPGQMTVEANLCLRLIVSETVLGGKKLYVINEKHATGCHLLSDSLADALKKTNQSYTLFTDQIPKSESELKESKNIVVCDYDALSEDEYDALKELEESFVSEGNTFEEVQLNTSLGFKDYGDGNSWICRMLRIGRIRNTAYLPKAYPIRIVSSEEELKSGDGIASVIIPETVRYDQVEDKIEMPEELKKDLYKKLLDGQNGLNLLIQNVPLRNMIRDELDSLQNLYMYVSGLDKSVSIDPKDIKSFNESLLQNTELYNKYTAEVQRCIGINAWNKLEPQSMPWLVTAMSEYESIKAIDSQMDFSGPVLLMSKVFETELTKRLGACYVDYLKKTYPSDYLDRLPEPLVEEFNGEKKVKREEKVTLGSIPFIMGVDAKGVLVSQADYDEFCRYAEKELFADTDHIEQTITNLCEIVYYVRVKFRNTSAHKKSINLQVATDCIEYCVTVKRKLGILMDMFRF